MVTPGDREHVCQVVKQYQGYMDPTPAYRDTYTVTCELMTLEYR